MTLACIITIMLRVQSSAVMIAEVAVVQLQLSCNQPGVMMSRMDWLLWVLL